MKQKLFGFVVFALGLLFFASAQANLILAEGKPTGQWYNPERDGEGFYVEIIDTGGNLQIGIAMYSYDAEGRQLWVVGNVAIDGDDTTATVPVIQIDGPVWGSGYDPDDRDVTDFGTITVRFTSCNTALFQVRNNVGLEDGDYSLVRVTNVVGIECTDPPPKPPEGEGVTPGEWGNGVTLCMNVAADGKSVTPENSPCPEGASVYVDRTGLFIDANGEIGIDLCVTKTFCSGTASISSEGTFNCVSDLGVIEGFFTSKTAMFGFAYVPQGANGGVCGSEWDMTPK